MKYMEYYKFYIKMVLLGIQLVNANDFSRISCVFPIYFSYTKTFLLSEDKIVANWSIIWLTVIGTAIIWKP